MARASGGLGLASMRNLRLNLQVTHVDRSAISSSFGYDIGRPSGATIPAAASILF